MRSQKDGIEKLQKTNPKQPKPKSSQKKRFEATFNSIRDIRKEYETASKCIKVSDIYLDEDSFASLTSEIEKDTKMKHHGLKSSKISANLLEYFEAPIFDKKLEKRKLKNLVEYFQVSHN